MFLIVTFLGWVGLLGSAYFLQEKLLFHPEPLPPDYAYGFSGNWMERTFNMNDGERLAALHFRAEPKRDNLSQQGVVLYFHGNAGNLSSWGEVAEDFVRLGFDVVLVDYRGYGKSSGSIQNEATLHEDAEQVYQVVAKEYGESEIVLLGRSLGTGIAAKLAADQNPHRLILETPYYDMISAGREHYPWLLPQLISRYRLATAQYLEQVECAIDLIHGTEDKIVPYAHSVRLQDRHSQLRLWTIQGGGHNDLREDPAYHQYLADILGSPLDT